VAGLRGPEEDLEVTAVAADGWLGEPALRGGRPLADPGERPLLVPRRPAPVPGARPGWLSFLSDLGLGGILADDMGLGKSVQTLALLDHERAAQGVPGTPPRTGPTLLVCPMSLVGTGSGKRSGLRRTWPCTCTTARTGCLAPTCMTR